MYDSLNISQSNKQTKILNYLRILNFTLDTYLYYNSIIYLPITYLFVRSFKTNVYLSWPFSSNHIDN